MINAIAIGNTGLLAAANNAGEEIPILQHFVVDGGWVAGSVFILPAGRRKGVRGLWFIGPCPTLPSLRGRLP